MSIKIQQIILKIVKEMSSADVFGADTQGSSVVDPETSTKFLMSVAGPKTKKSKKTKKFPLIRRNLKNSL